MVFTQRRGSSFHFWMPLWTFAAAFVRVFNFRAQDRSSTKSVELNRQSFRNEIGGDRVSIVVSHIYYYLSVVCQVATILLRRESRQVLRTFIFCKTSISIFVNDLDDTIEARKRASHKEIGIVGKKVVARARTKIDRTVGPPLSKNCAFHQRTTDLFSFLAEKKEDN